MRVLLDVDGVIADFVRGVLAAVQRITGRYYEPFQVTQYSIRDAIGISTAEWKRVVDEEITDDGFAFFLDAYPGAVEAVKKLADDHDVYFVTSPWNSSPTWVHDRSEWLVKKFGTTLGRKVVHTHHKELIAGDVLVDDKITTVQQWSNAHVGRVGVLWAMPHNQDSGWRLRTNDWAELRRIIDAP